jgi:hypothetical protein
MIFFLLSGARDHPGVDPVTDELDLKVVARQ